ncbi:hypothetical protein EON63_01045 [archaeon]|nr:MAG: hypothetical protein EON63_01045 [archaeon]
MTWTLVTSCPTPEGKVPSYSARTTYLNNGDVCVCFVMHAGYGCVYATLHMIRHTQSSSFEHISIAIPIHTNTYTHPYPYPYLYPYTLCEPYT